MMEMIAFLERLAMGLGTTADKLWGILLKQALISGITTLTLMTIGICLEICGLLFILRKTRIPPVTQEIEFPNAEWDSDAATIPWAIWGFSVFISIVVFSCYAENTICAFANPEYWALDKLLSACQVAQ